MKKKPPQGLPGLKTARLAANMTQTALARALDISDRQVQNWEGANGDPSVWAAAEVARVLGTTIEKLMEAPTP